MLGLVSGLSLSRPVFVGHSMGGMTAAVAVQRSPGTARGLVLVDPTFISPERQQAVWESDVAEQHRQALRLPRSALVAEARARHPRRSAEIIALQVDARLHTHASAFGVLRPPDPDFREIVRALVDVEQISDAGHGLPFDQPERLTGAVRSFLHALP